MQNFPLIDVLAYSVFDRGLVALDHSCKAMNDIIELRPYYNSTSTYDTLFNYIGSYEYAFRKAYDKNEVANKEFIKSGHYNSTFITYQQNFLNNYNQYYKFLNDEAGYKIEKAFEKCVSLYMDAKAIVKSYFNNKYWNTNELILNYNSTDKDDMVRKSLNKLPSLPKLTAKIDLPTNSPVTNLTVNDIESMNQFFYFLKTTNLFCIDLKYMVDDLQTFFNTTQNIGNALSMLDNILKDGEDADLQFSFLVYASYKFYEIPCNFSTDAHNAIYSQYKSLYNFMSLNPTPLGEVIDTCFDMYNDGNQVLTKYLGG